MAFERRREKRYYYSARRENGRVVKTYLGTGILAQQDAAAVVRRKRERLERSQRDSEFEQQLLSLRDPFEQFWAASEQAQRLALVAANYHCRRGEWRRRREQLPF